MSPMNCCSRLFDTLSDGRFTMLMRGHPNSNEKRATVLDLNFAVFPRVSIVMSKGLGHAHGMKGSPSSFAEEASTVRVVRRSGDFSIQ